MNPSKFKALRESFPSKPCIVIARTLTLLYCLLLLSGCSAIQMANPNNLEQCKTHAYLHTPLDLFISQRFPRNSPVRIGIVPFSSQANIAAYSAQDPGLGTELSYHVRNLILQQGIVPIVEMLPREDWPRKYEEFHAGNFGAINMAKKAHYDLVLVGQIEPMHSMETLGVHTKLIEVHQGITVWSGRSEVRTLRHEREKTRPYSWFIDRQPNRVYTRMLTEKLAHCVAKGILAEDPLVE